MTNREIAIRILRKDLKHWSSGSGHPIFSPEGDSALIDFITQALDAKDLRLKKLEEALRFYASGAPSRLGADRWKRARQALSEE